MLLALGFLTIPPSANGPNRLLAVGAGAGGGTNGPKNPSGDALGAGAGAATGLNIDSGDALGAGAGAGTMFKVGIEAGAGAGAATGEGAGAD